MTLWQSLLTLTLAATLLCEVAAQNGQNQKSAKVLVLGAGLSGMVTARTLQQEGEEDFIIIEGSSRIGGRVKSVTFEGQTIEAGSMFIQGGKKLNGAFDNPVLTLAEQYGVEIVAADFDATTFRDAKGMDVTDEAWERYGALDIAVEFASELSYNMSREDRSLYRPDTSQKVGLRLGGWSPQDALDLALQFFEIDFEVATRPGEASLRKYFMETYNHFEDVDFVSIDQNGGLEKIVTSLAEEFLTSQDERLVLNEVVERVEQNATHVIVTSSSGMTYVGEYAVVTFSLGVLQGGDVTFVPALPGWKTDSIQQLPFVAYTNIYVKFADDIDQFWDDSEFIVYAGKKYGFFQIWQNFDKLLDGNRVLQVVLTGEEAVLMESMSDAEIQAEIMNVLRAMYGDSLPEPANILVPRWGTDPLFRGSFSSWPPGYSDFSHEALRAPVGRIHFSGDATSKSYSGLLHGAYDAGLIQTQQLLDCLRQSEECAEEPFVPPFAARGCKYIKADNYDARAQMDDGSCRFTLVSSTPSMRSDNILLWAAIAAVGSLLFL